MIVTKEKMRAFQDVWATLIQTESKKELLIGNRNRGENHGAVIDNVNENMFGANLSVLLKHPSNFLILSYISVSSSR